MSRKQSLEDEEVNPLFPSLVLKPAFLSLCVSMSESAFLYMVVVVH